MGAERREMPAQKRYSSNYQDEDDDESLYEPQQRRNQRRRGKQSRRRGGGGGGEQSRAPEEELQQQQQRIQLERGEQGRAELEELAPNHDQESIRESSEDGYVFSEEYNTYTSTHAPNLFVFANRCTYIHESVCICMLAELRMCVLHFGAASCSAIDFSRFGFQILMGVELILKTLTSKFFVLMPYMYPHLHARVILFSRCQFAVFIVCSVVCLVRGLCYATWGCFI